MNKKQPQKKRLQYTDSLIASLLIVCYVIGHYSVQAAELSMTVTTSPKNAIVTENISYTITIFPIRSGITSGVNDVILTYGLPPNFNLVSTESSVGDCSSNGIVTCQLGTLDGTVATVTIIVTPTIEGTISSILNVNGLTTDNCQNNNEEGKTEVQLKMEEEEKTEEEGKTDEEGETTGETDEEGKTDEEGETDEEGKTDEEGETTVETPPVEKCKEIVTSTTVPIETTVLPLPDVTVQFSETTYTVSESAREASITITREGDSDRPLSVDVSTHDGSAVAEQDYTPVTTTLNWEEGDTEPKTFTILINDDLETEDEETVNLTLSNPIDALIGEANAQLVITDDEKPGDISLSAATYHVGEIDGAVTITVLRTDGSDGELIVDYVTSDETAMAGQDYTATLGTIKWDNGDLAPKTFTISIANDDIIEGEETFLITLTNPSNRAVLGQAVATVHILDNVSINDAVAALMAVARNPNQRAMAQTLGTICQSGQASADLQARCSEMLIHVGTQQGSVANILQQLAPEEFATQGRLSIEASSRQVRNISTRLMALRSGATGFQVENLKINIDGQTVPMPTEAELQLEGQPIPGHASTQLQSNTAHAFDLYKLGVFVNGNIGFGHKEETEQESGFDFNTIGLTGGVDYRFSDTFILGLALGYNLAKTDLYDDAGSIDMDGLNLSVYGTLYQAKQFYLDLLYSYGITRYDNQRKISYTLGETQVDQLANSDHNGDQQLFSLSGGYDFHFKALTITPTLRFDYLQAGIDGFRENMSISDAPGAGFGLAIESQNVKSLTMALGTQFALELPQDSGTTLIPQLNLEWVMETQNEQRWISGYFLEDAGREKFQLQTDEPDTHSS